MTRDITPKGKNIFLPSAEKLTPINSEMKLSGRFIRLSHPTNPNINSFVFGEIPTDNSTEAEISYHKDLVEYAIENGLALEPKLQPTEDDNSFVAKGGLADAGFFMLSSNASINLIHLFEKSSHYMFGGALEQRAESKRLLEILLPDFSVVIPS